MASFTGTAGNDLLTGTPGDDSLYGGLGADTLDGGSGDDYLSTGGWIAAIQAWGDDAGDLFEGGDGKDRLYGSSGADTLNGGAGDDTLQGGAGADILYGGDGNDYLQAGRWDSTAQAWVDDAGDLLDGGDGADRLNGNSGADTLNGGAGADTLQGGTGADALHGGDGNDYLQSGIWDPVAQAWIDDAGDLLDGGDGDDRLTASTGTDTLRGGGGNDHLDGGAGSDLLSGGAGDDAYQVDDAGDVVVELADEGADRIESSVSFALPDHVEDLTLDGTGATDGIGNSLNNLLTGSAGANRLIGGAGDDNLQGREGADTLDGGEGNDYLSTGAWSPVTKAWGDDAGDLLDGGEGNDTLSGNAGGDVLHGGGGDDTLQGGSGADKLYGGDGNDYLQTGRWDSTAQANVDDAGDLLDGGDGDDRLYSNAGADTLLGGSGNDTLSGDAGGDALDGGTGNDNLQGGAGADTLDGGAGDDTLQGSAGADTLHGGDGNDYLQAGGWDPTTQRWVDDAGNLLDGGDGNDTLLGVTGEDTLYGGDGNDFLNGGDGKDTLSGGAGRDSLIGGVGDDVFYMDDLQDRVYENAGEGYDTVIVSVSGAKIRPENIETITYVDGALPLSYWVDALVAGLYWGPVGAPTTLTYGFLTHSTDSTFRPFSAADEARALSVLGLWSQAAALSFVRASNPDDAQIRFGFFDILPAAGTASMPNPAGSTVKIDIRSTASVHLLLHETGHALGLKHPGNYSGSEAPPFLSAAEDGWDNTQLSYRSVSTSRPFSANYGSRLGSFDVAAAQYLYGVNSGINPGDTVYSYTQLVWPDMLIGDGGGIDVIDASDVAPQPAGFAGYDMTIDLRSGARIFAGPAQDLITAPSQVSINYGTVIENAIGSAGRDLITGNETDNVLSGKGGDDVLDGGVGADTLVGGAGDDTYAIDSAGDVVNEQAGEGVDLVRAAVSYTLSEHVEKLTLTGDDDIDGEGNGLGNVLTGNAGANRLDGRAGPDTLAGGAGDDVYEIDDAGDVVTELADEGVDLVRASVSHTLSANVEHLTLLGSGAIDGNGNALANLLQGNSGANHINGGGGDDTLDGSLGADTLAGGAGDDVFEIDDAGDVIVELASEGIDRVHSAVSHLLGANVEHLRLTGSADLDGTGNALNNVLTGSAGANRLDGRAGADALVGDAGDDALVGGAGADSLCGGTGSDTFLFVSADDSLLGAHDVIVDFEAADWIELAGIAGIALRFDAYGYSSTADATVAAIQADAGVVDEVVFFTDGATGFVYVQGAGSGTSFDGTLIELRGHKEIPALSQLAGVLDRTAPTPVAFSPADGAAGVPVDSNLVVTFSEPILRGTGSIRIKDGLGNVVQTFDAASSGRLTISGNTLTIDPGDFAHATQYLVEFPAGSLRDLAGNGYAGSASYDFTTQEAVVAPVNRTGTAVSDALLGGRGADTLTALAGNDFLIGLAGNDSLDGGDGFDTAWYTFSRAAYGVARSGGTVTISGLEGTDTLTAVERAQFADGAVAFDIDGNAGQTYRLYQAAFAREPDVPGLSFWIGAMDAGATLQAVAGQFLGSPEFVSKYGANPSNEQFVTALYQNVLNRAPDAGGLAFWVNQLNAGTITRPEVLIGFSESVENKANVLPAIDNGIAYSAPALPATGTAGNDVLIGALNADTLGGLVGRDLLIGLGGNDSLNGGAALDTAGYGGSRSLYTVVSGAATGITVTDTSGVDGTDTLVDIERLAFADGGLAFDIDGNAGQTYRLYQAAFARQPDVPGLSFWIAQMDNGEELPAVAQQFIASPEFVSKYGANPSNGDFVTALYQNVLNRAPDAGGLAFWVNQLDAGTISRPEVLIGFSESAENQTALIGVLQQGIEYVPFG